MAVNEFPFAASDGKIGVGVETIRRRGDAHVGAEDVALVIAERVAERDHAVRSDQIVMEAGAGHREHFAFEEFAFGFGAALEFEVLLGREARLGLGGHR